MKKDDYKLGDWDINDLHDPDVPKMDLTDEEMEEIRKEHERLGIKD